MVMKGARTSWQSRALPAHGQQCVCMAELDAVVAVFIILEEVKKLRKFQVLLDWCEDDVMPYCR